MKIQTTLAAILIVPAFMSANTAVASVPPAPPTAEVVDEYRVNMGTGQLAQSVKTVSIGGQLGLDHSIQLYSDLWAEGSFYGFVDGFDGGASYQDINADKVVTINTVNGEIRSFTSLSDLEPTLSNRVHVMRVHGPAGQHDFMVYKNGIVRYAYTSPTSGYEYRSVGDQGHSLVETDNRKYLIWTKPDGTETKYERGAPGTWTAGTGARLREVTYPNGFKIRIQEAGITTNTGYMLKYQRTTGLRTPDTITGVNLAVQYCSLTGSCSLGTQWPKAEFVWPSGTPNVFLQHGLSSSNYLFKVIDEHGGVTKLQYEPQNLCITTWGNEDQDCVQNPPNGSKWSPRLVGIQNPGSDQFNLEYDYKNIGYLDHWPTKSFWKLNSRMGSVISARTNGGEVNEYFGPTSSPGFITRNDADNQVRMVIDKPNVFYDAIFAKEGYFRYSDDLRNLIVEHRPVLGGGPWTYYEYNGPRGRLSKIKARESQGVYRTMAELGYASAYSTSCPVDKVNSCTDKTRVCNQPVWTRDALGNQTDYFYDSCARFGAPTKITEPADESSVRKATYYKYEPLHAYYHDADPSSGGTGIEQDPDPVWLLTEEHTCRSSTATESGCSGGDIDRVKTEYYYGPQNGAANNLHLRGKAIIAEGNGGASESRVWCYEYDDYGNLIGETKPKGNSSDLTECL